MAIRTLTQDVDDLYTMTWSLMVPGLHDNIFTQHPVWDKIYKNGNAKTQEGGKWIEVDLEYATSATAVAWITKTHDLATQVDNAAALELTTTAQWDWAYVTVALYRKFVDDVQNRGKAKRRDSVGTKLENSKKSLGQMFEETLFTLTNPGADKKILGLPNIIRDDPNPSGSNHLVGYIPQGKVEAQQVNTWWNNQFKDMTGMELTTNLIPEMRTMYNNCSGGGVDFPDLIVTTQLIQEIFEDETTEQKIITSDSVGDPLFGTVRFKGKPVVWSPSADVQHLRMINSKYLYWYYDPAVNFTLTDWRQYNTKLDRNAFIVVSGNLCCTNRSRQGVLFGVGA